MASSEDHVPRPRVNSHKFEHKLGKGFGKAIWVAPFVGAGWMQMRVVDGPIMPRLILPNARPNTPLLRTLPLLRPAYLCYKLYAVATELWLSRLGYYGIMGKCDATGATGLTV